VDTDVLVDSKIEDGRKIIAEMAKEGYPASVAFWLKPTSEGLWRLYISSPAIEDGKVGDAYVALYDCLQRVPNASVSMSHVKLLQDGRRIAQEAITIRDREPNRYLPIRLHGQYLGGMSIEEAYIYPPDRPMEVIAKGKEEVLRYLENESARRVGQPGQYLLARDERGELVAFVAGHAFIGSGALRVGNQSLVISDGILTGTLDD
jgi:hypothetical protein